MLGHIAREETAGRAVGTSQRAWGSDRARRFGFSPPLASRL